MTPNGEGESTRSIAIACQLRCASNPRAKTG